MIVLHLSYSHPCASKALSDRLASMLADSSSESGEDEGHYHGGYGGSHEQLGRQPLSFTDSESEDDEPASLPAKASPTSQTTPEKW